ncbi:MAG: hypothetical protein KC619_05050 [Myxococcales bacterium]|nr:hypothetical protein [Myxococcales bacterium]
MVQRAKTLTGLILQYLRTRWAGLGRGGKLFLFGGLVLAAVAAYQAGSCMLGGCHAAQQSPCQMRGDDAPCPYAAQRAADEAAADEAAADEDVPPCHRR